MKVRPLSEEIHPADEMYLYSRSLVHGDDRAARHLYFEKGRQIAEAIEQVAGAGFGGPEQVPSLLDFASGFGRSTRFVATAVDPGRITVCEIQRGAADFLQSTLAVDAVAAAARPEEFAPGRRFSMIFASSFFTHCPPERIAGWLDGLMKALASDGVLAFSVNDLAEAPPDANHSGPGVAFSGSSESAALSADDYGTTWVSEQHIRNLLADADRGDMQAERVPNGLCAHQDLWILRRGSAASRDLVYQRHPAGHVEDVASRSDAVHVAGWARDLDQPGGIEKIVVEVEGQPVLDLSPSYPDDSGRQTWSCELPSPRLGLDDLVVFDAVAASGRTSLLGAGSPRPFLARAEP